MTAKEFKAWFEGYCEGLGERPRTKKHFDKIKGKIEELEDAPCDRPHYYPYYSYPWIVTSPYYVDPIPTTATPTITWTSGTNLELAEGMNVNGASTTIVAGHPC